MPALTTWWIVDVAMLCSILFLKVWLRRIAHAVQGLEKARTDSAPWPNRPSNS